MACGTGGEGAAGVAPNREECALYEGAAAGVAAVVEGESKSPRMSWAMLRWAGAGAGEPPVAGAEDPELPKISARRSCVAGAAAWPFVAGALGMSSPRRSA